MTTPLSFATHRGPDGDLVLAAAGEIDMSNAKTFGAALTEAFTESGGTPFVVDLTAVEYLDSAGLAALFPHVDNVRLVAAPLLAPVLTIAGLDEVTIVKD